MQEQILLGIDTGGTYTDAVLFSHAKGVLAKAKSLTTKQDLAIGISGAVDAVLAKFAGAASDIALVSLSTTLATNSLVEGKGGSVGLVMIGFAEADMEKAGLREALGGDPVIFIPGGHDVQGNERSLDMSGLEGFLEANGEKVSGFAIAGYFAVRNASHEVRVKEYLTGKTGLPSTCSHELSAKLGGPKRALTTLLNARLIPVIQNLIQATNKHLKTTGIRAPVMVVRGDGAMVSAGFALNRPIETILSGPAASLIGAKFILGAKDAIISDIGGTTTDVAILEKGWPRIAPDGASVGGFTTMVEAVAMHTFGLGGDSAVHLDDQSPNGLVLGPRRQIPLALLAMDFPEIVNAELERQLASDNPGVLAGRFAWSNIIEGQGLPNLKSTETKLLEKLTNTPAPLDTLLKGSSEAGTLNRLVSRGLAHVSGLTPSDAMHVLGLQNNWQAEAAHAGAQLLLRQKDRFGNPIARSVEDLATRIKDQLTRQSGDYILQTCMAENEMEIGPGARTLMDRALDREAGFVKLTLSLDRPLVGLGASARVYYPAIGERLASECLVPEDADVANAIGAVAGEVRIRRSIIVSSNDGGGSFSILLEQGQEVLADEEKAITSAKAHLRAQVEKLITDAGAIDPEYREEITIDAPTIEGSRHFVQAVITLSAIGLPDLSKIG